MSEIQAQERKHAWYLRNKARLADSYKRYYEANKGKRKAYNKEYEKQILGYKIALKSAKARALKRGIEFSLTKKWAIARWTGKCELTGLNFVRSTGRGGGPGTYSCSIDRLDSADEEMLLIAKHLLQGLVPQ